MLFIILTKSQASYYDLLEHLIQPALWKKEPQDLHDLGQQQNI